jgi:predicted MFS family arabinose efflux permease
VTRRPPPARPLLLFVVAGAILSLSMGMRQSLGLFLLPVTVDLGISAAAFSFALALQSIVWGLSQPFIGMLADRYGARPVLLATALTYVAGLSIMAVSNDALGINIAGFLIGIGIAGTSVGILMGVVSRATPPERRSQTVGAVAGVGSLGTLILAPVGQALISAFDWRTALLAFAGIAMVMTVLASTIRAMPVHTDGAAPDAPGALSLGQTLRAAARHPGYLAMTISFFACGFQLNFITTHLAPFLELCGVPPTVSATSLGLIGLFNAVGTYLVGLLGARYSQRRLLALVYLVRTVAIVVYLSLPITVVSTLIFASVMGFTWLSVVPLVAGLIGRMFGLGYFNTLYGVAFVSHQVGAFAGAWMGGLVFDFTGTYTAAWIALIVIGALAFALQWSMDDRPADAGTPGVTAAAHPA